MAGRRSLVRFVPAFTLIAFALLAAIGCESPVVSTVTQPVDPAGSAPANRPPVVALEGPDAVTLGETVEIIVTADDPDGDPLTVGWAFVETPTGSELTTDDLDTNGLSATFTPDMLGEFALRVTVSDGTDAVSDTHSVTVVAAPIDPPGAFSLGSPTNAATGVAQSGAVLSWTAASGATAYDVYVAAGSLPGTPTATVTGTTHSLGTLAYSTLYQWRVVARNEGGSSTSSTWSFTTEPATPTVSNPNPADGSTGVPIETMITWSATNADEYDLYMRFGRMVEFNLVQAGLKTTGFAASLEGGQTYEWYVVARNAEKSATGPIWRFATQPVDLWAGLAAYWAFEGNFDDWSGWQHHLQRYNLQSDAPVRLTVDRFSRERAAVDTRGPGDFLYTAPDKGSPLTNFDRGFSASFWIRDMGNNTEAGVLWHGADQSQGYEIRLDSKAGVSFVRHTSTVLTIGPDSLTGVWYAPEWNHVVISWDFGSRRIEAWVNNRVVATADADRFTDTNGSLVVGLSSIGWLNAHLDDMRIYTRPLNESEVLTLFTEEYGK